MKKCEFTAEKIIGWLARSLPNAEQVNWLELGPVSMSFEWRLNTYKINIEGMHVDQRERDGGLLVGSDCATLIEALLKKQWLLEKEWRSNGEPTKDVDLKEV